MKMKPKVFKPEQLEVLKSAVAVQTPSATVQKSTDPVNFPVFDIPVNAKVLVYVPNHTVINKETNEVELRMDKPWIHTLVNGKRYQKIRCIKGLSEELGYSGECPICNGESEPWALANEMIKEQCKIRSLNPTDANNETVTAIKREQYSKRVIKAPDQYYTFPIVVIETDPTDFKKIVYDENGVPKHKAYWYTISKSAYEKKWCKTLEGMEDEPTHPGGEFFILNYTYESKSGEYNKRDSARELQVVAKKLKVDHSFLEMLDRETEEWDVVKATETVVDNQLFDEADIQEEVDKVLAGTREKLAIYESMAGANGAPALGAGPAFNLAPPVGDDGIGGLPMNDGIDED